MKIYTATGDGGKTSLFSGERIEKCDDRIEAYGDVDELSAVIGVLMAHLPEALDGLQGELIQIQSDLFHLGAWLATTPDSSLTEQLSPINEAPIIRLEENIDRMEKRLPPLSSFILPGGHRAAAFAHLARTVCRRTERHVIRLNRSESSKGNPRDPLKHIIIYLNRLSDYFFVLARYCNATMNIFDIPWKK